jgi:hypothetical protein
MDALREYIRESVNQTLNEVWKDVVDIEARVRIKVNQPTDPTVLDVMTVMRGLYKVITIKQKGNLSAPDVNGHQFMHVIVGFEDTNDANVIDLARGLLSVPSVDIVRILSYEGKPYRDADGKPVILKR